MIRGKGQVIHISFPDPAQAAGTDDEKLLVFRQVRDDIREKVLERLKLLAEAVV